MAAVDEYFMSLDAPTRAAFERVRDLVMAEVPDAVQGTSYGMAALRYRGKPLLGFRAARDHLSIFPFSPQAVDAVREDLTAFVISKGTIRFSAACPLPDDVVSRLVRSRVAEIDLSAPRA
jgi:uncharacterized protein YdhG (YjbR/CyaY superfamily)